MAGFLHAEFGKTPQHKFARWKRTSFSCSAWSPLRWLAPGRRH